MASMPAMPNTEIISMIIALIAVLIAYKEHRFARNMAEVEGKFKKPEISISYENRKIEDVIWSFPIPREATIELPLRFQIKNNGEKSATNMELFIRLPKELLNNELYEENKILNEADGIKYRWMDENNYAKVLIVSIKQILPKQELNIIHYVNIKEATSFESNCITKSRDNVNLNVKINCEYAYWIALVLYQDNSEPISRSVVLSIIDTSENSIKNYFNEINSAIKKEYDTLKYSERISYYLDRMRGRHEEKEILLFGCKEKDLVKDENLPIYRVKHFTGCAVYKSPKGFVIPALEIWDPIFSPDAGKIISRQIREMKKHH